MGTKLIHSFMKLMGFGSCVQVVEECYDYSEGTLKSGKKRRIKRHLKICPPCVRFVATYRAVQLLGKTIKPEKLSEEQKQQLLEGLNLK